MPVQKSRAETEMIVTRAPLGMRERVKRMATANHRSVNGELVSLLTKALAKHEAPPARDRSKGQGG